MPAQPQTAHDELERHSNRHCAPVCFSHMTALQIARQIDASGLAAKTGSRNLPPRQSPSKEDLEKTFAALMQFHPALQVGLPAHILMNETSRCRYSSMCKPHACTMPLSGKSFYRLADGIFLSIPALAFVQMATQEEDLIALLELGYELCGSYQTARTGVASAYQVVPLSSVRKLRGYVAKNPSLRGARKVERALRYLADGSASLRETKQALVYGLPMMYGGYGLGIPRMNYEVQASDAAYAISGRRSFRCDLCWPQAKIDVEYQSRENHEGEVSRIRDSRRTNALASMGWTVIGVTNDELDSLTATDTIAHTIRQRLGLREHVRVAHYHARKLKLRRKLGLPTRYV